MKGNTNKWTNKKKIKALGKGCSQRKMGYSKKEIRWQNKTCLAWCSVGHDVNITSTRYQNVWQDFQNISFTKRVRWGCQSSVSPRPHRQNTRRPHEHGSDLYLRVHSSPRPSPHHTATFHICNRNGVTRTSLLNILSTRNKIHQFEREFQMTESEFMN